MLGITMITPIYGITLIKHPHVACGCVIRMWSGISEGQRLTVFFWAYCRVLFALVVVDMKL